MGSDNGAEAGGYTLAVCTRLFFWNSKSGRDPPTHPESGVPPPPLTPVGRVGGIIVAVEDDARADDGLEAGGGACRTFCTEKI